MYSMVFSDRSSKGFATPPPIDLSGFIFVLLIFSLNEKSGFLFSGPTTKNSYFFVTSLIFQNFN